MSKIIKTTWHSDELGTETLNALEEVESKHLQAIIKIRNHDTSFDHTAENSCEVCGKTITEKGLKHATVVLCSNNVRVVLGAKCAKTLKNLLDRIPREDAAMRFNPEDECAYCGEGDSEEKGIVYDRLESPDGMGRSVYLHNECVDPYFDEIADYQSDHWRHNPDESAVTELLPTVEYFDETRPPIITDCPHKKPASIKLCRKCDRLQEELQDDWSMGLMPLEEAKLKPSERTGRSRYKITSTRSGPSRAYRNPRGYSPEDIKKKVYESLILPSEYSGRLRAKSTSDIRHELSFYSGIVTSAQTISKALDLLEAEGLVRHQGSGPNSKWRSLTAEERKARKARGRRIAKEIETAAALTALGYKAFKNPRGEGVLLSLSAAKKLVTALGKRPKKKTKKKARKKTPAKKRKRRCGNCNRIGHNSRTCGKRRRKKKA